jgi:hypothetical protein
MVLVKNNTTTSVQSNNNEKGNILIYPNPSNGKFIVEMENGKGVIEIYNVFGEKVFQSKISNPKSEINLNLSNGMYFYQVKDNKQFISTGKLIIQ